MKAFLYFDHISVFKNWISRATRKKGPRWKECEHPALVGLMSPSDIAKTEDAYCDLFPIKPNNKRMYVLAGMFLEITCNILPNYFLRNLIFCLKCA